MKNQDPYSFDAILNSISQENLSQKNKTAAENALWEGQEHLLSKDQQEHLEAYHYIQEQKRLHEEQRYYEYELF